MLQCKSGYSSFSRDFMDESEKMKGVQTGTTTVGLVCKDGIVLASDRRATMGYLIASKDIDKIYQVSDRIAMTIAGGVGDAQMLIRWMNAELKLYELKHEKPATVEAAATLLANILAQYKYFPFWVQLLIGGIDEKPRLFSVDMLGGITEEKYTSTGSGSPIAYGVLEELFVQDKDISVNLPVAAKAVSAAMKRDAASGERVDLCTVTKAGFRRMEKEEVAKLIGS
jgi:proteasome beta subunit